ncbi:MAG: hypothetical protein MW689_001598 [Thermodesulfobacteria bacterium]|nr:hypothetical protein [Thermodesulfobacteriota bacterium]MCU4138027.1 hypothetical protein [Thermodesulfobacteriota bacterium]
MKKFLIFIFINLFIFSIVFAQEKPNVEVITPQAEEVKSQKIKDLIYFPVPYIPVLKDLEYQAENSALLRTGGVLTGMLVFKGKYTLKSLVEFYKVQMVNQGWEEIGAFSSKITFIAYKRPEGTAFISISQGWYYAELRIVVMLTGVKQ